MSQAVNIKGFLTLTPCEETEAESQSGQVWLTLGMDAQYTPNAPVPGHLWHWGLGPHCPLPLPGRGSSLN